MLTGRGHVAMRFLRPLLALVILKSLIGTPTTLAQSGAEGPAIGRGVQALRGLAQKGLDPGESGLAALALIKAEVPAQDPSLVSLMAKAQSRFNGSQFLPSRQGGTNVYEAAVIGLAFANADPIGKKAEVQAIASYIISKQNGNGSWDYSSRTQGDTSITQYALLGLWEAENIGVEIPPHHWDNAASWYISNQSSSGAWRYHPDEAQYTDTMSMTAAGVGSLLICKRQLERYRKPGASSESGSAFLQPLVVEGGAQARKYDPRTTNGSINDSAKRGIAWLNGHINSTDKQIVGPSVYYSLYGLERVGALADKQTMGGTNWYDRGLQILLSTQTQTGTWNSDHGEGPNTSWAILFMTKATAKSVRKLEIKRLKGGTLLGGRGLPDNIDNLTIAQGRVVVRPMNGAVEQMLSVLADPRALNADQALAGLIDRYRAEGPKAIKPHKDRLRKMLEDRDSGLRRVACWGLGRTGDLDVAPDLIETLRRDNDPAVVNEARVALQVLSRKIEGYGPPLESTPEDRKQAALKWRAWYDAVRPPDRTDADEEGSK